MTTAFFRGPPEKLLDFVRQYREIAALASSRSSLKPLMPRPRVPLAGVRSSTSSTSTWRATASRIYGWGIRPSSINHLQVGLFDSIWSALRPIVPTRWSTRGRNSFTALHTSHLLRRTEAPMAAQALSWVTLEAAGIESDTITLLARALSLQCLRQELVSTHDVLVRAVAAKRKLRQLRLDAVEADLHRFRMTYRSAKQPAQRDAAHAAAAIAARESTLERELLRLHDMGPTEWLGEIETFLGVNERGQMTDANRWLCLLLPKQSHELPDVGRARESLKRLMESGLPALVREVTTWSGRLSRPSSTADWLDRRESDLEAFIHALRASRNQALHAGVFAVEGDRLLSDGAASLIDMTLEFLGNWYRQRRGTTLTEVPVDIVDQLATRFEVVRDYLAGAAETTTTSTLPC